MRRLAALALLLASCTAPSSAPDPTTSPPGVPGAIVSGDASARVPASASGPEPSGAPYPPALAYVAGSEGGVPLTTPMPGALASGRATWYCSDGRDGSPRSACPRGYGPDDLVAAIDRKDTPFRKGDVVVVRYACGKGCERAVRVRIVDTCGCTGGKIIDLTIGAFTRLAPWGTGVIPVEVRSAGAAPTLPPTDEENP